MKKILVVIVNYGYEQLNYLNTIIKEFKNFKNYEIDIIVNSNVNIENEYIYKVNIIKNLDNWNYLPLTCRKTILEEYEKYDIIIYTENDHLFLEKHIDNYLKYEKILPKNYISGQIQIEKYGNMLYYPAFHGKFDWKYNSLKKFNNLKFAEFSNLHQASFIISKEKLKILLDDDINFEKYFGDPNYSIKCRVNTDIYSKFIKVICIDEFYENLIHHLPNFYVNGDNNRLKLGIDDNEMKIRIKKLKNL